MRELGLNESSLAIDIARAMFNADGFAVVGLSGTKVRNADDPERVILSGSVKSIREIEAEGPKAAEYPITGMAKIARDPELNTLSATVTTEFLGEAVPDPFDLPVQRWPGDL